MDNNTIEVTNCWALSAGLVVVEIKHSLRGIPEGTIITNGTETRIIYKRIIFNHTSDEQKVFRNETTTLSFLSFKNIDAMNASMNYILENEANGIFQYTLKEKKGIPAGIYSVK